MPKHYDRVGRARRRLGMTLVEVLQTISIIGLLSSLSVTVLAGSFRVHHSVLKHYRELEMSEQFARRWRDDVARSVDVQILAAEPGADDESRRVERLMLTQRIAGQRYGIVYAVRGELITRSRTREGENAGQDGWPLPTGRKLRFTTETAAGSGGEESETIVVSAQLENADEGRMSNDPPARSSPSQLWLAVCKRSPATGNTEELP